MVSSKNISKLVLLFLATSSATTIKPANAFTQAPLTIKDQRGFLQLTNDANKSVEISLEVFSITTDQKKTVASNIPMAASEAEQIIRLRPTHFRLNPGSSRTIPYTIINSAQPFYLCGVTSQGLFTLRVCSHWHPAPIASGGLSLETEQKRKSF